MNFISNFLDVFKCNKLIKNVIKLTILGAYQFPIGINY